MVAPPDIERDLASVSENWGDFGGAGGGSTTSSRRLFQARPGRNTRENLQGNRNKRFDDWID